MTAPLSPASSTDTSALDRFCASCGEIFTPIVNSVGRVSTTCQDDDCQRVERNKRAIRAASRRQPL
jgi:hypothetical protein